MNKVERSRDRDFRRSYEINGKQYIFIPKSGGITLKMYYGVLVEQGDAVVAFKIKD